MHDQRTRSFTGRSPGQSGGAAGEPCRAARPSGPRRSGFARRRIAAAMKISPGAVPARSRAFAERPSTRRREQPFSPDLRLLSPRPPPFRRLETIARPENSPQALENAEFALEDHMASGNADPQDVARPRLANGASERIVALQNLGLPVAGRARGSSGRRGKRGGGGGSGVCLVSL